MKRLNKQGFSIVELAIVVVIVGVIAGVGLYVRERQSNAKVAEADSAVVDRFPLKTTKKRILDGSNYNGQNFVWCYRVRNSCHHNYQDYNAADIFVTTDTRVVAAKSGRVVSAINRRGGVGSTVQIKGSNGLLYYYAHMANGSVSVRNGQSVSAGQSLGLVGSSGQAVNTAPHLHFDALPSGYNSRPECSGASCNRHPFINVQAGLQTQWNNNQGFTN